VKRRLLIALYAPAALALAVGPAAAGSDAARAGALEPGLAAGPTTSSPSPAPAPSGHIDVIEVAGLVDRVVADFLERSLRSAERGGAEALVLQLDSAGAVVPQSELDDLVARISRSRTPVAVWVGPSGARAYGGAFELVRAAFVSAMAPGTHVGREQGARATGCRRARPRVPESARGFHPADANGAGRSDHR